MAKESGEDFKATNAEHQERPSNGASIGAYVGERHLPPVSFGGLIMIDDKPYGMTVHHMLDEPEGEEEELEQEIQEPILRSSGRYLDMPDLTLSESSVYSSGDEEYMYELSDYDSDISEDGFASDEEGEDDDDSASSDSVLEPGDIKGIPQGCGDEYMITQPAIDDVDIKTFYPDAETRDEDHLDSFGLGEIYASSGIRRRTENSMVHEIDWALFEFHPSRCPNANRISASKRFCQKDTYPQTVAPLASLSNLSVHCMARTSGLQSGHIMPAMVIVKIYGRQTPSSSYQVSGKLGVPGDSGAWVVDNEHGRACGHVLAWSSRKKVAYICPMDVLLRDIGETLGAKSVSFPGGEEVYAPALADKKNPNIQEASVGIEEMLKNFKLPPTPTEIDGIDPKEVGEDNRSFLPIRLVDGGNPSTICLVEGVSSPKGSTPRSMDYGKAEPMENWNVHEKSFTVHADEVDSGVEVDEGGHSGM